MDYVFGNETEVRTFAKGIRNTKKDYLSHRVLILYALLKMGKRHFTLLY